MYRGAPIVGGHDTYRYTNTSVSRFTDLRNKVNLQEKNPSNLYWLPTDVDKYCGQCNIMETCHSCFPFMIFHMILLYPQHLWCGKHNYFHHQFKLLLWPARMWLIAPCGRPYHPLLSWWLIKLFTCCWTLSIMQRWSILILKLNFNNVCKKHVL